MAPGPLGPLVGRMERLLARFDRAGDHRGAFLRVYTHMTRKVEARMSGGFFVDPHWVVRVAERFAGMYFNALTAFDEGRRAPPAWHLAFEQAGRKRCFLLQDIVLGVNAHINNDLPQTLAGILADEQDWQDPALMIRRRFDHDQINRVLHEIIPAVEDEAANRYGRLLRPLGKLLGTLDDALAAHRLKLFRDNTWRMAEFLLAARSPGERAAVRHWIEQDALEVAKAVDQWGALPGTRGLAGWTRRMRLL